MGGLVLCHVCKTVGIPVPILILAKEQPPYYHSDRISKLRYDNGGSVD